VSILNHPPAFIGRKTLAAELDIAESTVDDFVDRGILPPPIKLSSGCVRWKWCDVEAAIDAKHVDQIQAPVDPYLAGAANVTAASSITNITEGRRRAS
jgi:predicted DNA-binding transcriptional regulator AlpA